MLKGLFGRVKNLVRGRATIDDDLMEELEEALIEADVPVKIALSLVEETRDRAERDHVTDGDGLLQIMRNIVRRQLTPFEAPLNHSEQPPTVFLMLGVNGVGKTTTLAKLAHRYQSAGKSTMMVAADTFRAAAIEQCEVWAGRVKCDIVRQEIGADPGAVVFDALQAAKARDTHIAIIDTAGRLHTKQNLMAELYQTTKQNKMHHAAESDGICTGELLVLRPRAAAQRFLLDYVLNPDFIAVVDSSTYGAKMPRANWDYIGNLPALIPPSEEQRSIVAFLDRETAWIDALVGKVEKSIELLRGYRIALISAAVTGKIDVRKEVLAG